jgi:GT2 family glycosyltransferase
LPALLKQKSSDTEFIYIDNGSSDGTVEYIKEQIEQNGDKKIRLIENGKNLGVSVAKNIAVKAAEGEYLLLLDDDMLVENESFLSNLIAFHRTLENPGIVMPFFVGVEELGNRLTWSYGTYYYLFGIHKKKRKVDYQKVLDQKGPIEIAIGQGGAIFTTKKVWNDLGGFDESQLFNLDDDDLSTRALIYGYKNYLYNGEYIIHLGMVKRLDPKRYATNDLTYYSGKAKPMIKNFSWSTIIWMLFFFSGKAVAESIWHSIVMRYPAIFFANLHSMLNFVITLPDTLRKRKAIQANRKVDDSYILNLKSPKY